MKEVPFSTRIRIAVIIGLVVLVVLFIGMLIFVNSNNNSNEDKSNDEEIEAETEKKFVGYGVICNDDNENELVSIYDPLDYDMLLSLHDADELDFIDFDYDDDNIALLYVGSGRMKVYIYDTNSLEGTLIIDSVDDYQCSFIYDNNYIYYVAKGDVNYSDGVNTALTNNSIYRYNIDEKQKEVVINTGSDNSEIVSAAINDGIVYYMMNNYNGNLATCSTNIGIVNLDTKEINDIINSETIGHEIYLSGDYLAITLGETNHTVYVYNCITQEIIDNEIGFYKGEGELQDHIKFNDEYIIFQDGAKIVLYDLSGEIVNEELYASDSEIEKILLIGNDILQVTETENVCEINFVDSTIKDSDIKVLDILNIN